MENKENRSRKCRATGKVVFSSLIEAKWRMFQFKLKLRIKNKVDGKRVKHRMGKYACKRAYYCKFCRGYHITHWDKAKFLKYKGQVASWATSEVPGNWNYLLE